MNLSIYDGYLDIDYNRQTFIVYKCDECGKEVERCATDIPPHKCGYCGGTFFKWNEYFLD